MAVSAAVLEIANATIITPTRSYFIIFYVAYLKHIPDPFFGGHEECPGGSCLKQIQFQLLIVFSGKTVGQKMAELLKPYMRKRKAQLMNVKQLNQILKVLPPST